MTTSEAAFEAPAFRNFSATDWNQQTVRTDYAKAWGPAKNSMDFDIYFEGVNSNPLTFDFLAWKDNTLKEAAHASWSGAGWSFTVFTNNFNDNYDRNAVPLPGALLLLGAGLVRLAAYGRSRC